MWDKGFIRPFGRLSKRHFLVTLALLLATLLSATITTVRPSSAAPGATWDNQSQIKYGDDSYTGPLDENPNVVPKSAVATFISTDDSNIVKIIYFPKGSDLSEAGNAKYLTAKFHEDTGKYSDPSPPKTISIDAQPTQSESDGGSCQSAGAIGWIVCPVTDLIAKGVDMLYGLIIDFLQVEPLTNDQNNVIYRGWEYMRNLANVAFIIAFMVIIYSQITGAGLTSYGIKKLLPRLLFAAVLMNTSYWVCAIGVDISNFLGVSLENFFLSIREGLMSSTTISGSFPNWEEITAAILGMGAVTWAGAAIVVSSGGVLALLVPVLVAGALSLLIAILILAARQAFIVVLIIVSPLAFVAYLLPNTDKYFKKWSDAFMTLLLMFPIFSVLFGGAQLAGSAIILSSRSIVELIFGMAVQIVPLAITPIILKLSTSTLAQVAGFLNNPKRGVLDRSRNWSKQFNEDQRNRGIKHNKFARMFDTRKRGKEDRRKSIQARNDNLYHRSARYKAIDQTNRAIDREQKHIEAGHDMEWNVKLKTDRHQFEKEMRARTTQSAAEAAKNRIDAAYEEVKSGELPSDLYPGPYYRRDSEMLRIRNDAQSASRDVALTSMRKSMAERSQQQELARELKDENSNLEIDGKSLVEYAGGVRGISGQRSVLATAKSNVSGPIIEDIKNIKNTLDYDVAKDNDELLRRFSKATTTEERVAYAQAMFQNGSPGAKYGRAALRALDNNPAINSSDRSDFKELMTTDSSILAKGKDVKLYLTQAKDSAGNLKKFDDVTADLSTWSGLSASEFTAQAASVQEHALDQLRLNNHSEYIRVIDNIRNNPNALNNMPLPVQEKYSVYSDNFKAERERMGNPLPDIGHYTGEDMSQKQTIKELYRDVTAQNAQAAPAPTRFEDGTTLNIDRDE